MGVGPGPRRWPVMRRIVLGPFTPTTEVDYCDPDGGGATTTNPF
jgi:hypothetical protein